MLEPISLRPDEQQLFPPTDGAKTSTICSLAFQLGNHEGQPRSQSFVVAAVADAKMQLLLFHVELITHKLSLSHTHYIYIYMIYACLFSIRMWPKNSPSHYKFTITCTKNDYYLNTALRYLEHLINLDDINNTVLNYSYF